MIIACSSKEARTVGTCRHRNLSAVHRFVIDNGFLASTFRSVLNHFRAGDSLLSMSYSFRGFAALAPSYKFQHCTNTSNFPPLHFNV